jgi:predicted enzyme related to lactoylglutathione lyase
MSTDNVPEIGSVGWKDLTVNDAEQIKTFYESVTGWKAEPLSMGDYSDYIMKTPEGTIVGGICHARGANSGLPPQWLIYITVADIEESVAKCLSLGGKAVTPVKTFGNEAKYCVIQDPAGAFSALWQAI